MKFGVKFDYFFMNDFEIKINSGAMNLFSIEEVCMANENLFTIFRKVLLHNHVIYNFFLLYNSLELKEHFVSRQKLILLFFIYFLFCKYLRKYFRYEINSLTFCLFYFKQKKNSKFLL